MLESVAHGEEGRGSDEMKWGVRRDGKIFFFFQAEDGIRDYKVTGVQTCALPIYRAVSKWIFLCLFTV